MLKLSVSNWQLTIKFVNSTSTTFVKEQNFFDIYSESNFFCIYGLRPFYQLTTRLNLFHNFSTIRQPLEPGEDVTEVIDLFETYGEKFKVLIKCSKVLVIHLTICPEPLDFDIVPKFVFSDSIFLSNDVLHLPLDNPSNDIS